MLTITSMPTSKLHHIGHGFIIVILTSNKIEKITANNTFHLSTSSDHNHRHLTALDWVPIHPFIQIISKYHEQWRPYSDYTPISNSVPPNNANALIPLPSTPMNKDTDAFYNNISSDNTNCYFYPLKHCHETKRKIEPTWSALFLLGGIITTFDTTKTDTINTPLHSLQRTYLLYFFWGENSRTREVHDVIDPLRQMTSPSFQEINCSLYNEENAPAN